MAEEKLQSMQGIQEVVERDGQQKGRTHNTKGDFSREKRLRQQSKDPRTPPSHQPAAEITPSPSPRPRPPNELEEGEVEEVCDISIPPSDVLVVEGQAAEPFSTDSAQRLSGQIMVWNGKLIECVTKLTA
ncbi:hypothetical protein AB205_0040520 [Aquarana catesbeiana]|uniref:Uncharacterized protein n=1 Tax=Aquarana catesbeiana TaxID=8400 RepID=A0A2G9NJT7_AQUCT|nr:hypothetical protein AB205_0040520 [Aquarana catesbeiana]